MDILNGRVLLVAYGCPRSGTTVARRFAYQVKGCIATKLSEAAELHPRRSTHGLLNLAYALQDCQTVFLRTVRDPMEVVESFLYMRRKDKKIKGRKTSSDSDILQMIIQESEGTAAQREIVEKPRRLIAKPVWVEMRYEELSDPSYRADLARQLKAVNLDAEAAVSWLDNMWMQEPVRPGRLTDGVGRVSTEVQREWFRQQLDEVTRREGYA